MSHENVELVRQGVELWVQGDLGALLELSDPQVGWDISTYPVPGVPNEGHGRGSYEQMLDRLMRRPGGHWNRRNDSERILATYASGWNEYRAEIVEIIDPSQDQVVVVLHEAARTRATDLVLGRHMSQLWTVRDGRLAFFRVFRTKQAALQAAGERSTSLGGEEKDEVSSDEGD